jgi:hypothetical protein
MVFGVVADVLAVVGVGVIYLWVHLLCRWSYVKGRLEGRQLEATEWCEAFDQIQVPNWQNVPVEDEKNRGQQEAAHRLYVQVFRAAKEAIGQELVTTRIDAMRAETDRAGSEDER